MSKKRISKKEAKKETKIEPKKEVQTIEKKTAKHDTGVIVIAALGILLSLLLIITGVFLIAISNSVGAPLCEGSELCTSMPPELLMLTGAASLILGIIALAAFYLLLKMKKLGWMIVTIVGALSIISGIISLAQGSIAAIVTVVLWLIIVCYLWTKKSLFS